MANKIMLMMDKILLRKRALIECVIDALKSQCQIEHSRHRSVWGGVTTILAGLVMYTYLPKKPSLRFDQQERQALDLIQLAQ
jgi:Transposase DDE domain